MVLESTSIYTISAYHHNGLWLDRRSEWYVFDTNILLHIRWYVIKLPTNILNSKIYFFD